MRKCSTMCFQAQFLDFDYLEYFLSYTVSKFFIWEKTYCIYRNMVKIEKNRHFTYLFELTSIFHSFFYFWQCSHHNFEKIRPVCVHTFSRGIWIWNQNCKKMNLENWLPIGVGFLSDPGATWRFHFFSILTLWSDSSPSKPNLRGRHNKNSNFDEKKN